MSLKININRIHGSLCDLFGEVSITERSSKEKGHYIEIVASKDGIEAVLEIAKTSLERSTFDWGYYPNPEDRAHMVERTSNLDTIASDVSEIFEKRRFDSEYLAKINQ